jgi:hypothetical protein
MFRQKFRGEQLAVKDWIPVSTATSSPRKTRRVA